LDNARTVLSLKAGPHEIAVTATGEQGGQPVQVRLSWVTPQQQQNNYERAIAAARAAKKAVVFVWGRDRPDVFHLPGDQDKLIHDVAAANPNTIVVFNTSLPVSMAWLDDVKAVVQMWWPGDRGGPATANVLLGRVNPAGRLPFTWPHTLDHMLANDPAHPERSNRGVEGRTTYSEGIFMGYRWFDKQDVAPLFPFGHGLSYTTFEYSRLRIASVADGGLDVSFTVRNAGKVTGEEVPQVYLGPPRQPPPEAQFAMRALAAFDRVPVAAGQSKSVTLHVPLRRLQYWSTSNSKWVTAAGTRPVYVAASSRDIRLNGDATVAPKR
jgi:beta-glucosidase